MTLLDTVALAVTNLWRRKMRTMLTVLGVIIGTACIVIMVALGLGGLEQFNEQIMENQDLTKIEIYSGYSANAPTLNEKTIEEIKNFTGVKSATGVISMPAYIKMGKYRASTQLYAVDPDAMGFEFAEGRVFPNTDAIEIVLGQGARQNFSDPHESKGSSYATSYSMSDGGEYVEPTGPDVDWLTQNLKLYPYYDDGSNVESTPDNPAPLEYRASFCGMLEPSNDQENYSMYISMEAAKRMIKENRKLFQNMNIKGDAFSQAYVNCEDIESVKSVLDQIKSMGYEAYSPTEWINDMQDEYKRQQTQLIAIGLISLLVSAIGIANTMLASILERRREIGVMKVIGLSIKKIDLMFLVEAALIGLIGGVIALGVCYGIALWLNSGAAQATGGQFLGMYFENGVRLTIPWWLALGAVAISAGVGVISGIYPAWQATKMSPLEAIRSGN